MSKQMIWLNEYEVTDEYARKMIELILDNIVTLEMETLGQTGASPEVTHDDTTGKYSVTVNLVSVVDTTNPVYKVTVNGIEYGCHVASSKTGQYQLISNNSGAVLADVNGLAATVYSDANITSASISRMQSMSVRE